MHRQEDKWSTNEDIADEFERIALKRFDLVYELDLGSKWAQVIHQQHHQEGQSPQETGW